jgi:hypothetical protein
LSHPDYLSAKKLRHKKPFSTMEQNEREGFATKASWKNLPMDNPKRIEIDLKLTEDQFLKVSRGLIPEEMEDKWFIYFEDGWLFFHRSWTGFELYRAKLNREKEGYSIKEFQVERNPEKYSNEDDQQDIASLTFLIARGLLGMPIDQIHGILQMKSPRDAVKGWGLFGSMLFPKPDSLSD